jgi:hypothetical protein
MVQYFADSFLLFSLAKLSLGFSVQPGGIGPLSWHAGGVGELSVLLPSLLFADDPPICPRSLDLWWWWWSGWDGLFDVDPPRVFELIDGDCGFWVVVVVGGEEGGHLPLASGVKPLRHIAVVCCRDGNGDVDGGGIKFEGGGGVEEGCAAPAEGGNGFVLAGYLVPQAKSFMVVVLMQS